MASFTDFMGWTDLQSHSKFLPPNVMVTAEDLALHGENQASSDFLHEGMSRQMIYTVAATGAQYYMELALYVHPVGAADVTLASGTTSSQNGKALLYTGALAGAIAPVDTIAGIFLDLYYSTTVDWTTSGAHSVVQTLTAGDAIWLVRRGRMSLNAVVASAIADGTPLVTTAAALATDPTLLSAATTVTHVKAALIAQSSEVSLGGASIGFARGAVASSFVDAELTLPIRYKRYGST